jgi:hypothetical protein
MDVGRGSRYMVGWLNQVYYNHYHYIFTKFIDHLGLPLLENEKSIHISEVGGDAIGIGVSGSGNIIGKEVNVTFISPNEWNQIFRPLENLQVIEEIKPKLLSKHNAASKVLEELLGEFHDTYKTMGDTLYELANLSFSDDEDKMKAKKFLYDAKQGYLANKIEAARAHCDSIDYAYDEILKPWFSFSDLNDKEKNKLENIFKFRSKQADTEFVNGLHIVENFLRDSSTKIFEKVQEDKLQEATAMVKEIAKSMEYPMINFRDATRKLLSLQTEFQKLRRHNTHQDKEQIGKEKQEEYRIDILDKLEKLAELKQSGILTEEEFQSLKQNYLEGKISL